jgi:hypothetical protein
MPHGRDFDELTGDRFNRHRLAAEMVFGTRSVAFSMREGHTMPFTRAVALRSFSEVREERPMGEIAEADKEADKRSRRGGDQ